MNAKPVANRPEGLLLALFGPLAVADVQRGCGVGAVLANRQRRAHGRIHTAAEHDYCSRLVSACFAT